MQRANSSRPAGCFHIIRWHSSTRSTPALKRCFTSRSSANTVRGRGIIGDRSPDHLEAHDKAHNRLGVVQCDHANCDCVRWPTGCNAANLPARAEQRYLECCNCHVCRRNVIEVTDPRDETPRLFCRRCAERKVLAVTFKGRQPLVRWRHADDGVMAFLAVWR